MLIAFVSLLIISLTLGLAYANSIPASSYELSLSSIPNSQNYTITNFTVIPFNTPTIVAIYSTWASNTVPINALNTPVIVLSEVQAATNASNSQSLYNYYDSLLMNSTPITGFHEISSFSPDIGSYSAGFVGTTTNGTYVVVVLFDVGDNFALIEAKENANSPNPTPIPITIAQGFYSQLSALPTTTSTASTTSTTTTYTTSSSTSASTTTISTASTTTVPITSCPTPTITSITPDSAAPYTRITINGYGLWNLSWASLGAPQVRIYSPATQTWVGAQFYGASFDYINVTVPYMQPTNAPTTLDVTVPCGTWPNTGTTSAQFTVLAPTPSMSATAAVNSSLYYNYGDYISSSVTYLPQYVLQAETSVSVNGGVGPYNYTFYMKNATQTNYTKLYNSGYQPSNHWGYGITNVSLNVWKQGPLALLPGHSYYAMIEAQDSAGNVVYSNPVEFSFPSFSETGFVNVTFTIAQALGVNPDTTALYLSSYLGGTDSPIEWGQLNGSPHYSIKVPVGSYVAYDYASPITGGVYGTLYFQNVESTAATCGNLTAQSGTFTVGPHGCLDDANYNTAQSTTTTVPEGYYNYSGNFAGAEVYMALLVPQNVADYSDSYGGGTINNFYTTNSSYSCLNGQSLPVYTAPEQFYGYYLASNYGEAGACAYITLEFRNSFSPTPTQIVYWSNYNYTGTWAGQRIGLKFAYNNSAQYIPAIESLPDARLVGTLNNFDTNDPYHSCLDGESLNVWVAPNEYPGDYIVHNGNQGTQCAYLTLLFPESNTVVTPINITNYWGGNPSVSSANGTSCSSFVLSTSDIELLNLPAHHIFNATCTWNGGPLDLYYGSGDSGAILFNVTGVSNGETYFNSSQFPNGGFSNVWCNSYYSGAVLPAQTYKISMWVGRGGGACGNAFVYLTNSTGEGYSQGKSQISVSAYPELQVIYAGQSAYLLSSATGGVPPYTYQWSATGPFGSGYVPIAGGTSSTYLVGTNSLQQTFDYHFRLNVTDSASDKAVSNPVSVLVLGAGTHGVIPLNVTTQDVALNLTNGAIFNLNLSDDGTSLQIRPGLGTQNRTTFIVSNDTSLTPPAPHGSTKLIGLNVSTLASNVTLNFTMHYNCALPASRIAPYTLLNNTWTRVSNFTVNQQNCTVSFALNRDPVVGLMENSSTVTTPTTTASTTATTSQSVQPSSPAQSGYSYLYPYIGILVVIVIIAALFKLTRPKSPGVAAQQGAKSAGQS